MVSKASTSSKPDNEAMLLSYRDLLPTSSFGSERSLESLSSEDLPRLLMGSKKKEITEFSRDLTKEEGPASSFLQSSEDVQIDCVSQSMASDSISSLPTLATINGHNSLEDLSCASFSKRTIRHNGSLRSLDSVCESYEEDNFELPESKILDELAPRFVISPTRDKDHRQQRWQ
eukprot:scaffold26716_cov137-Cylindrotheca_fusiformis.AAC.4